MRRAVRLEPQELEPETFPYRKGRRDRQSDTVKHRLDRAERMLGEMSYYVTTLLRIVKQKYKSPSPNGDWSSKWAMSAVERLMKDLAETVSRKDQEQPWLPREQHLHAKKEDWPLQLLTQVSLGHIEVKWDEEKGLLWRRIPRAAEES